MVPMRGIEPPRAFAHQILNLAWLPSYTTSAKIGAREGNQTLRILIDSQVSPSGGLTSMFKNWRSWVNSNHQREDLQSSALPVGATRPLFGGGSEI